MVKSALALTIALTLGLIAPAAAQEKFGDKRVYHTIKSEAMQIPDKEGHVLVVSETHGYDLKDGRTAVNRVVADLVKGNGRTFGYGTATEKDGDMLHYSFEGRVTTAADSGGKPATTSQGTWVITGGTGKWQQRDARGTFKSAVVGPGTSVSDWEGTWEAKK
jgi:hypothetical protein